MIKESIIHTLRLKFSRNKLLPPPIGLEPPSKILESQTCRDFCNSYKEKARYIQPLVKLIPTCAQCGSPVTDSLDPEVEEQGQLKKGKYINSVWTCNECSNAQRSGNISQGEQDLGKASASDVSPNTPRADEANL